MTQFNINEMIKVKLTPFGLSLIEQYFHIYPNLVPTADKDGFQQFQLWEFMEIFGSSFAHGGAQIIENNDIYFEIENKKP